MNVFTKKDKEVAKRNTVDYLLKKNEQLDRNLKYHAAKGDSKKIKELLKQKRSVERAMLYHYTPEFKKCRC